MPGFFADTQHIAELYLKEPPAEVKKKSLKDLSKFQLMQKILTTDISELESAEDKLIHTANNVSYLRKAMFAGHSSIHRGYYDSVTDAGVVMVKDAISGELIRKDASYLTTEGTFISNASQKITIYSTQDHSLRLSLMKIINRMFSFGSEGDMAKRLSAREHFVKRENYVVLPNTHLYHKITLDNMKVAASSNSFVSTLSRAFHYFHMQHEGMLENSESIFANGEGMTDAYLQDLNRQMFGGRTHISHGDIVNSFGIYIVPEKYIGKENTMADPSVYIPEDSPLFPGCIMLLDRGNFNTESERAMITAQARNQQSEIRTRPIVEIDYRGQRNQLSFPTLPGFTGARWWGTRVVLQELGVARSFPLPLALTLMTRQLLTENHRTHNNDGQIEGYTLRVPDVKVSFKMTAEEMTFYKTGNTAKPCFMGIELEYQIRSPKEPGMDKRVYMSQIIKGIANSPLGDYCIMKSDSSIGDVGFEMVTIPATLNYHKEILDEHFFKKELEAPLMGAITCGMHVHIGKDAFEEPTINLKPDDKGGMKAVKKTHFSRIALGKFIVFMNSKDNYKFIADLSGREENEYCRPNPIRAKNKYGIDTGVGFVGKGMSLKKKTTTYERRSIVNTQNDHTIEIRIFRSTNDRNALFRRLEFCAALVSFCKQAGVRELTIYHFIRHILDKDRAKNYPCLIMWLASRGYIGVTKKESTKTGKKTKIYGPILIENPLDKIASEAKKSTVAKKPQENVSQGQQQPNTVFVQSDYHFGLAEGLIGQLGIF